MTQPSWRSVSFWLCRRQDARVIDLPEDADAFELDGQRLVLELDPQVGRDATWRRTASVPRDQLLGRERLRTGRRRSPAPAATVLGRDMFAELR